MELTWLGTAAFRVVIGNTVVWLDPYLSRNKHARPPVTLKPQDIAAADYIFLSHGHFDHVYDVPEIARRTGARVIASSTVCNALHKAGLPDHQLRPVQGTKTMGLGSFNVLAFPGGHIRFDRRLILQTLRRAKWGILPALWLGLRYPRGEVLGYLLSTKEHSLCFLGSVGFRREQIERITPGVALVAVQGHSDICRIAAHLVARLEPRWVIPHHFDDFYPPLSQAIDLAPFVAEVKRSSPGTCIHIPRVGQKLIYERGELRVADSSEDQ